MIELIDVVKDYPMNRRQVRVINRANLTIGRHQQVGILGRNGAGKSTLMRLISGVELPTSGIIKRAMSVSWPLAFGGAFQGSLTGYDNLRFICRVYGVDPSDKYEFVEEFSELAGYMSEPIHNYSAGMRARLAFAISMIVDFECFLIDEVIAVGDASFHEKCLVELFEKRADRAKVIISHDTGYIREHCQSAAVLSQGILHYFDELEEALDFYSSVASLRTLV